MDAFQPLDDLLVVELSTGIAGAYATKLFADAGAEVVKIEPPGGDPLRRLTVHDGDPGAEGAALFRFLCAGKASVLGSSTDPEVERLIARTSSDRRVREDWRRIQRKLERIAGSWGWSYAEGRFDFPKRAEESPAERAVPAATP